MSLEDFAEEYDKLPSMNRIQVLQAYKTEDLSNIQDATAYALAEKMLNYDKEDGMVKEKEKKLVQKKESQEKPTQELVVYPKGSYSETKAIAADLYKARSFADLQNTEQAVVKILAGKELGLPPMLSLSTVYIVNGRTAVETKVIASLIKKSGEYDYKIIRQDNKGATVQFLQNGKPIDDAFKGMVSFTEDDAKRANLLKKNIYQQYPSTMYLWRAIAFGARKYCPHIMMNAYSYEEMDLEVDAGGSLIKKAEPTQATEQVVVDGEVVETSEKKEEPEVTQNTKEFRKQLQDTYGLDRIKEVKKNLKLEKKLKDLEEADFKKVVEELQK